MYTEKKNYLLETRVQSMQNTLNFDDPEDLLAALAKEDGSGKLWESFIKAFTTNHTYFFREADHFNHVVRDIRTRNLQSVNIWIAAASTGEEVYSLGISLLEYGIRDFKILASDINRQNLVWMKKGRYGESRFMSTPPEYRKRYFHEVQDAKDIQWEVIPLLKEHVYAKVLNLSQNLMFQNLFDFVFCRNVLMYFEEGVQNRVITMLEHNLKPEGLLFIGHSEVIINPGPYLLQEHLACFRKRGSV